MRILFLNPPFKYRYSRTGARWPTRTKSDTVCYPCWLAYATGVSQQHGHTVKLIDAPARNYTLEDIIRMKREFKPDMIVMDTSTPSIHNDIQVAEAINEGEKIIFVGPHASALPQETLSMSEKIDFICKGEYDFTVLELAEFIEAGRSDWQSIKGLVWRDNGTVKVNEPRPLIQDLDSLPFVASIYKQFVDTKDYFYSMCTYPMMQIFSSRGCPYRCNYCVWPQVLQGHQFRTRSIKNVVDEIEYIKKELPMIKEIIMEDDTFTFDKKRVLDFCKEIKARGLDVTWTANARADVPYDVLKEMKSAGLRMLIVGFESGNQQVLNNCKKGITVEGAKQFAKDCKKLGVQIMGCFMLGLPGETPQTAEDTFKLAKEVKSDFLFFNLACPFPGTEFYEWAKTNRYLTSHDFRDWADDEGRLRCLVSYPNFSAAEMRKKVDEFAVHYMFQPQFIGRTMKHIIKNPADVFRYMRAAKTIFGYLEKKDSSSNAYGKSPLEKSSS